MDVLVCVLFSIQFGMRVSFIYLGPHESLKDPSRYLLTINILLLYVHPPEPAGRSSDMLCAT